MTAQSIEARLIEDRRRLHVCSEIEDLVDSVSEARPDLAIHELTKILPEPQQARLRALLEEAQD